ncbi:MAG: hypothetical protein ACK4ND_12845 [Cytophagaceae bacterium]
MSIKTEKERIIKKLEEVNDYTLLQAINNLLNYALDRKDSIEEMLEESEKDIEAGNLVLHEDLKKDIRGWRKNK